MKFNLYGIDKACDYVFTDADDESEIMVNGGSLSEQGFCVTMEQKRSSKIYIYKKS